jgi:hypothetical protein
MTGARALARMWALLARVRRLRVERKRVALGHARSGLQQASGDVAARRETIEQHAAQRSRIVDACAHDRLAASLWRGTLRLHDSRAPALHDALSAALRRERAAEADVRMASGALQREMKRCEDAQTRVREQNARLRDDE